MFRNGSISIGFGWDEQQLMFRNGSISIGFGWAGRKIHGETCPVVPAMALKAEKVKWL
jgi:hypothetical protein